MNVKMRRIEENAAYDDDDLHDDPILDLNTLAKARTFVDRVINDSSPAEILRYLEVHLSLRHKPGRGRRQTRKKGGSCEDPHDIRIYNMLALADSIHDACPHNNSYQQTPASIMRFMNIKPSDLPETIDGKVLLSEDKFIDKMRTRSSLQFAADTVQNPMFQCNINHFDRQAVVIPTPTSQRDIISILYKKAMSGVQTESRKQTRILKIPVYSAWDTGKHRKNYKVQLEQLLDLASRMRDWFGANCDFQPDMYSPLIKFLLATKFTDQAFHDRFVVEKKWTTVKYLTEIQDAVSRAGDNAKCSNI